MCVFEEFLIMLTRGELSFNLRCMKILGKLGFLPIKIEEDTGLFRVLPGQTNMRWCMFAAATQFSVTYSAVLLLLKVFHMDIANAVSKFLIEFIFVYSFELTLCLGLYTFIKWSKVSETLVNDSLTGDKIEVRRTERKKRKLCEYTWLELITRILPLCTFPWGTVVVAAKQVTKIWPADSAVASTMFVLNVFAEFVSIFMCSASIYWVLLNQILFMGHVCYTLDLQLNKLR